MRSELEDPATAPAQKALPTRWRAWVFAGKAWMLRLKRWVREANDAPRRFARQSRMPEPRLLIESRTPLYSSDTAAEFALQAGKVHNLRIAARSLNGVVLPAGETFSFWAHVPRPTRRRGFAAGRELREGCVIPSVGGGLCQLSNALYDSALKAGFEIVERHAHSRRVPGSAAAEGRDATIFWNYVDLRFRARVDVQLDVQLDRQQLVVGFLAPGSTPQTVPSAKLTPAIPRGEATESCEVCGVADCFRNPIAAALAWMSAQRQRRDWLFVPLNSRRWGFGRYRWKTTGFAAVREARRATLRRSLNSRRLAAQGAARQRALLAMDEAMAAAFARRLPALSTHLVISQNLLPFLWRNGDLGGRTFDVLMTRLPLAELQRTLDQAAAAFPRSPTLADFRAAAGIVEAETAALAAARHWITSHSAISRLGGTRAIRIPWQIPRAVPVVRGEWFVFPASTLGRKGAWELRAVARELDLPVRLTGPVLEDPGFWSGVRTERSGSDWSVDGRWCCRRGWNINRVVFCRRWPQACRWSLPKPADWPGFPVSLPFRQAIWMP